VGASRVAITGATGLIGGALADALRRDGHRVQRVTRSAAAAGPDDVVWDPERGTIDAAKLEGVAAVVHLAAEPIRATRASDETLRRIRRSRVQGTDLIARTIAELSEPPGVLVSGSAVGYYGDGGDEVITESSPAGDDFLAEVCAAWERAAAPAADAGVRVVYARTGVVLARGGPLLDTVEVPFKLGVGGRVGSGRQWVPWISLQDEVRALRFLIERDDAAGPYNLTAPTPARNAEFTEALGTVLRRPTVFPIPPFAVRLVYGGLGASLATASQRVVPERLLEAGFEFTETDITAALREALGRSEAA
jgi:uncharacterized protein